MPVYLLCGKGLEMPLGVTPHAPGQGGASWRYSCRECERLFPSLTALKRHLRSHVGEKPFECKLCHQRSRDYSAMIKHLRTHNGALPYRCTVCQEYCSSLAVMQKHIKTHLPEEVPPDWSLEESYLYLCYL
ncbi:zinc finger and BTB domain-containing protein 16-like [Chiloscyllium plagiosum]|uniref:zinc finger and BTB domain-containing protein 16-like n=1 Tax=Chiloscyllium plagiosum TaxID=36176 RepID=UPI001CB83D53|nr:zinc finger and BTB domain-containing protein 16-like [Chiloscyllium plagiosum]